MGVHTRGRHQMPRQSTHERIVTDPAVLLGKPIVRGTRVPVYLILGLVEAGQTPEKRSLTTTQI